MITFTGVTSLPAEWSPVDEDIAFVNCLFSGAGVPNVDGGPKETDGPRELMITSDMRINCIRIA
jgi:hypothetical protein